MPREGRERGVTVVIGAVLMFGLLVSALAMYQVNVVPTENEQTEWDHHQRVTDELVDLRNAIVNAGNQNSTREAAVSLGTQYDSRTFSINPPDPSGTIRTNASDEPIEVTFEDGRSTSFNTSSVEYEPGYYEYDAPRTVIEHGLVYASGDANVVRDEGSVITDDAVVLPIVQGDLSESRSTGVSVSVRTVDVYRVSTDVSTIDVPTASADVWTDSYSVSNNSDGTVRIDSTDRRVYVAQIVLGDGEANEHDRRKLAGFGEKLTTGGERGESNEFDLAWTDDSVTGSPGDTLALTATIDDEIEGANVDFSYRDPNESIDRVVREDSRFSDGVAEFEARLAADATDGDGVDVYVSAGGATKRATVSVDDGDDAGASFELGSFDAPTSGTTGETIRPAVTVTNVGNESGSGTVEYVFDGGVVDSAPVTLDPGRNETVTFGYTLPSSGTYEHHARIDDTSTPPQQIDVSSADTVVDFEIEDVGLDEDTQMVSFNSDRIGSNGRATIDLTDPQGRGVEYADATVTLVGGGNDGVQFDADGSEIVYTAQGRPDSDRIEIRVSNIDVIGDPDTRYVARYTDDGTEPVTDTFTIEGVSPEFTELEVAANANFDFWNWAYYSDAISVDHAVDYPEAVTGVTYAVYDETGSRIGSASQSSTEGSVTIDLSDPQYDPMTVTVTLRSADGDHCLEGPVEVAETATLADFSPCQ